MRYKIEEGPVAGLLKPYTIYGGPGVPENHLTPRKKKPNDAFLGMF